jgi:hypothetical protein
VKRLGSDEGQVSVFTILCMTCLLGCIALATDVGIFFHVKREMQIAADSAAIAGAAEETYSNTTGGADTDATLNGFTNGVNGVTVTVNKPPKSGSYTGCDHCVEVIISQSQPTLFMSFFRSSMPVAARAVADNSSTSGCVYTLGTSGPDLSMSGNVTLSVSTCGIIDDSSSSNALQANGNVTLNAQSIGVVGGVSQSGNVTITPTPTTGITAVTNPLASLSDPTVPNPCTPGTVSGSSITAGCYNGISLSGNNSLTLGSGTYIINGNFSMAGNSSITGSNVTLVLEGSASFAGNTTMNLTAPTTGSYSGLLFFVPSTNSSSISIVGNSGSTLEGIIYAPNTAINFTGNSGSTIYTDFVVKSLTMVGNSSFSSYASINSNSVLSSGIKLVE